MRNLKVGHYTNTLKSTGLSVFLFAKPVVAVYHLCGSSPASRDLHALELESHVAEIHGLLFTGGSAFGLGAANGVLQYLHEQKIGKAMPKGGVVPIVPVAGIYDLSAREGSVLTAENAYQACLDAKEKNEATGCIGAGTGALVGKIVPEASRMTGGIGYAMLSLGDGLEVGAYAVVNAIGDIRDQQGNIIAGAKLPNGKFADCERYLLAGGRESHLSSTNTTLVLVVTNAKFSKLELKRIAKVAIAGMARAISPVFTQYDGDVLFCVSQGEHHATELVVATLAAKVVQQAIINAVKTSVVMT